MKKTLAILLAVLLTFSSVSLLGTGTALAEQQTGDVLFTSDYLWSDQGAKWNDTDSILTKMDENGDGTNDFGRLTALESKNKPQIYSPTVQVIPGNSYELSFYVRVPNDANTEEFTYTNQYAPYITIYQPNSTYKYWSEGQNEYAYTGGEEYGAKPRRTDFVSNVTIGEYATYTKDKYSSYGYQVFYNCVGGKEVKLNEALGEWTKMTISFTAIASADNDGPQDVAVSFGFYKKGTFCYDFKDVVFKCTNAVEAPKVQTILKSDFANGFGTWNPYKSSKATKEIVIETENGEAYAKIPAYSQTYLISTPVELVPGNQYELTFDVRIPDDSDAFYSGGKPYGPFFAIYETGVDSSTGKAKTTPTIDEESAANNNLYSEEATKVNRRSDVDIVWQFNDKTHNDTNTVFRDNDQASVFGKSEAADPAVTYAEWTTFKATFTATASAENAGAQTVAIAFGCGFNAETTRWLNVKNVKLVETRAGGSEEEPDQPDQPDTPVEPDKAEPDTTNAVYYQGFETTTKEDLKDIFTEVPSFVHDANGSFVSDDSVTGSKSAALFGMYQHTFIPFDKTKLTKDTLYTFSMDWKLSSSSCTINNVYFVGYTPTEGVSFQMGNRGLAGKASIKGTGNWEKLTFDFKISEAQYNKYEKFGIYINYNAPNSNPEGLMYLDTLLVKPSENADTPAQALKLYEQPRTEDTIKVLAFGNSFSNDGTSFIPQIAYADGKDLRIADASIGGCSLSTHYALSVMNSANYSFNYRTPDAQKVASVNHTKVTMEQALISSDWDYIVIQQVSTMSGRKDTFEPYLKNLIEKFKEYCPNAKIVFQLTWAYQDGISKEGYEKYNNDQLTMYNAILETYEFYAEKYDVEFVVPSGVTIQKLREQISEDLFTSEAELDFTRDGYHLSDKGRVAAAFTWYEMFTGISAEDTKIDLTTSAYGTLSETTGKQLDISAAEAAAIKKAAHEAAMLYKKSIPGDFDGTGVADLEDVTLLAKHFAGWDSELDDAALDLNGDGAKNLKDLVLLAQFVAGWDVELVK